MGLDYYDASLFGTIPVLYARDRAALDAEFPPCRRRASAAKTSPAVAHTSHRAAHAHSLRLLDRRRPRRQPLRHRIHHLRLTRNGAQSASFLLPRTIAHRLRAARLLAASGRHLTRASRTPPQLSRAPAPPSWRISPKPFPTKPRGSPSPASLFVSAATRPTSCIATCSSRRTHRSPSTPTPQSSPTICSCCATRSHPTMSNSSFCSVAGRRHVLAGV